MRLNKNGFEQLTNCYILEAPKTINLCIPSCYNSDMGNFPLLQRYKIRGNLNLGFNQLFADTLEKHGLSYCFKYYYLKHKIPLWELEFWINNAKG